MKIDGRCHCGEITFETEVDPNTLHICHCTDCQTLSGSAFRANIPAPAEHFALLSGTPKTYIKTAESEQTPSRFLRHLRHADLFLGGRGSAELWPTCRDDQTTRRVLTAAADLAAVCAPLGGRARHRPGGPEGLRRPIRMRMRNRCGYDEVCLLGWFELGGFEPKEIEEQMQMFAEEAVPVIAREGGGKVELPARGLDLVV